MLYSQELYLLQQKRNNILNIKELKMNLNKTEKEVLQDISNLTDKVVALSDEINTLRNNYRFDGNVVGNLTANFLLEIQANIEEQHRKLCMLHYAFDVKK